MDYFVDEWDDDAAAVCDICIYYDGLWDEDMPIGAGTARYADGSTYVGDFQDGKRDGYGTITYLDGTTYIGMWVNDRPNGNGKTIDPNDNEHHGYHANGTSIVSTIY